jgi:hypothetical protein
MSKVRWFILGLFGVMAFNSGLSAQNIDADRPWENFTGWNITVSKEYQGCVAIASYQDGTTVRLGYDGLAKDYFFNFSNIKWRAYPLRTDYEVRFEIGRGRNLSGFFHTVIRENLPTFEIGNVKGSFLDDIANGSGFRIFQENDQLASLSLIGSRRALNSMVECEQSLMHD